MKLNIMITLAAACTVSLHADPRSSTDYTVPTDSIDAAGNRATSTDYTHDGSLGGIVGLSTVVAPAETAKAGYVGQLYEVIGLQLAAAPTNVNEGATLQLSASQLLDDSSTLTVASTSVLWSVSSGPLTTIDSAGEGTADIVYENTAATAQGIYEGTTNQLGVMVLNVNSDDFGIYAADGIDDDWQNLYFGLENPNAGPGIDFDDDGQNNFFEFIAGVVPTDDLSYFAFTHATVPGQPTHQDLIFSPRFNNRTYTVEQKNDLTATTWDPLTSSSTSDNFDERIVTDLNATNSAKFYHVTISKP